MLYCVEHVVIGIDTVYFFVYSSYMSNYIPIDRKIQSVRPIIIYRPWLFLW